MRYEIRTVNESRNIIARVFGWIQRDETKKRSMDYFVSWADKFWLQAGEQLRELTTKFTNELKADFGAQFSGVKLSLEGARALDEEQRIQMRSLATEVVSKIQMTKLNDVLAILAENAFTDDQKRYYILIDKLDENWANTETRCRFIRALLEETKHFRKIPKVKIVTALRRDLLDLVFDRTRDAGFQEEKYDAYIVRLLWSRDDIARLLDMRVREVYRRQYSSEHVQFSDIFPAPKKYGGKMALDFIVERTLLRPRDAIQFANECFNSAADRQKISWRAMRAAEGEYSTKRLKSLKEEWYEFYPALDNLKELLRGVSDAFTRSALGGKRLEDLCVEFEDYKGPDQCAVLASNLYRPGSKVSEGEVISQIIMCFYHVGLVGVRLSPTDPWMWSYIDQSRITRSEAKRSISLSVHKIFRRSLGIMDNDANVDMLDPTY